MPFTYLVTAFREVFISDGIVFTNHGMFTIIFWVITFVMFIWGNSVFKKNKKRFCRCFIELLFSKYLRVLIKKGENHI